MIVDRDLDRAVRTWLEDGVTDLPDRVLDRVLDQLPATPQRRAWWPARWNGPSSGMVRVAAAFAVVALAVALGAQFLAPAAGPPVGGPSPTDPSPSASASATAGLTPLATETALPDSGRLAPGTYIVDEPFPVRITFDLGDGWTVWSGIADDSAAIYRESPDPPRGRGLVFAVVANVYADPCDVGKGGRVPQLGPGIDDLATALAGQPGTVASPITDVTLDGRAGKYLEYTAPSLPCVHSIARWPSTAGDRQALVDESDRVWILDVDGVRLVIDAFSFPGTSPDDHAEIQAIVDSIRIGRPATP